MESPLFLTDLLTSPELVGGASVPARRIGTLAPAREHARPTCRFMVRMRNWKRPACPRNQELLLVFEPLSDILIL